MAQLIDNCIWAYTDLSLLSACMHATIHNVAYDG